jgi:antitoxin (DNA-binding transcriptional repressor) of toxin-antitoxin stability system
MSETHIEVGLFEAKTHLSRLVDELKGGRVFIITRRGVPVAELRLPRKARPLQLGEGREDGEGFFMAEDFDETPEGFEDYQP